MVDEPKTAMNDVAKPGTTAPDASGKPVIVGHTSVVADPMVSKQSEPAAGSMKQRIMPTSNSDAVQKEAAKEDDTAHAEADEPKKDTSADRQVRLGELIESGEYNVSINQKRTSSAALTFFGTLLGVVLVAAIILFVLIDLKTIDVGIKLPFSIFNKTEEKTADDSTNKEAIQAALVKTTSFPRTKLRFTYDSASWKYAITKGADESDYFSSLTLQEDSLSSISFSEYTSATSADTVGDCTNDASCTVGISDFKSEKIPNVKKRDLYVVSYIKKSTLAQSTKPYTTHIRIGKVASLVDMNKQDSYSISDDPSLRATVFANVSVNGTDNPLSAKATIEEAQAVFASQKYVALKQILLSAAD